jgi:hypothetical protein
MSTMASAIAIARASVNACSDVMELCALLAVVIGQPAYAN